MGRAERERLEDRVVELLDRAGELEAICATEPRDVIAEAQLWAVRDEALRIARMLEQEDRADL